MTAQMILMVLMNMKGMSQKKVAEAMGVKRQSLNISMNKTKSMTCDRLCNAAEAVGYKIVVMPQDATVPDDSYILTAE